MSSNYSKHRMHVTALAVASCLAASIGPAQAENWYDRVLISGFASAKYQRTDEDVPFNGHPEDAGVDDKGSFGGTKFALNVTAMVTDRLTLASQFIGSREEGNYATHLDWAFASFQLSDAFTARTGKLKFPVGLVNEYVDVGYAYPWLHAPEVIYSELNTGPQATRESYSGASLLWSQPVGAWTFGADLFGGDVKLESSTERKLGGLTLRAEWDDILQLQASSYSGTMGYTTNPLIEGKQHKATLVGAKLDWNDILVYAEASDVTMQDVPALSSKSWYTTLGYRIGDYLPSVTYQSFKQDDGDAQKIASLGLRYELMRNTSLKFEVAQIKTTVGTSEDEAAGGLFVGAPSDNKTMKYGVGIDIVF